MSKENLSAAIKDCEKQNKYNDSFPKDVRQMVQDHFSSMMDGLLLQEHIRRKELGLPFSQPEVADFKKNIFKTLSKNDVETTNNNSKNDLCFSSTMGMKNFARFKNPQVEKALQEGKHKIIDQMENGLLKILLMNG